MLDVMLNTIFLLIAFLPGRAFDVAEDAWNFRHDRTFANAPRVVRAFEIVDAETDQAIADAKAIAWYRFDYFRDKTIVGSTDASGIARLPMVDRNLKHARVTVTSRNHLRRSINLVALSPMKDRFEFEPGPIVVPLYSKPRPVSGLRVAANFEGLIRFRSERYSERTQPRGILYLPTFPDGQRVFLHFADTDAVSVVPSAPPISGHDVGGDPLVIVVGRQHLPQPKPGERVDGRAA